MAIRIPILTSFDPKGLRKANAEFAKLQGSIGSLGRNFAVAGAALGGIGIALGKSVNVASNLAESVNAVNVAFGASAQGILDFGKTASTTLGVSQVDFNNAAVRFSAFAERIVGSGGDASKFIADISTRASDFASVFNIEVSEALGVFQSGLAGEAEPLKRFGINLLDSEVKAYAAANGIGELGRELTETEKVQARYGLLMQATSKTAGDFANTSDGLANGMRILKAQITDTQAEIGGQLLPVLAEIMPVVREMATEFGQKLSNAVKSVDWRATITAVADLTGFLITHIETITKTIGVIFALNTAFKVLNIAVAAVKTGFALYTWAVAQSTAGMGAASIAAKGLAAALRLIPWIGIAAGLTAATVALVEMYPQLEKNRQATGQFREKLKEATVTTDELRAAAQKQTSQMTSYRDTIDTTTIAVNKLKTGLENIPKEVNTTINVRGNLDPSSSAFLRATRDFGEGGAYEAARKLPDTYESLFGDKKKTQNTGGTRTPARTFEQSIIRDTKLANAQGKLQGLKFSQGYIDGLLGSQGGLRQANKLIKKATSLPIKKQTALVERTNKRFAGTIGEVNRVAAENAALLQQQAAKEAADLAAAQEKAQQDEANAIAERERIYQSFADSVKNTFAGIKNSIIGAFDLTQLGGSTNAITRNMEKLLTRLRSFAANVKNLASMGLNPALLQQVISAGPLGGARLAEALVMGGQAGLSAINAGYSEFGTLSGQIAQTGTESLFGTSQQQTVYNINVDGGVGSGSTIGKAIVDAIKAYERTSGAVWQGA